MQSQQNHGSGRDTASREQPQESLSREKDSTAPPWLETKHQVLRKALARPREGVRSRDTGGYQGIKDAAPGNDAGIQGAEPANQTEPFLAAR